MTHEDITARLDKADEHLQKSEYALAEKLANDVLASGVVGKGEEARMLNILGECCTRTTRFDEALIHHGKALVTAEAALNLSLQSRAMNGVARTRYYKRDDLAMALQDAEHALLLAERGADKKQQIAALTIIGCALKELDDSPRALHHHTRALALAEEIEDVNSVLWNLGNVAEMHLEIGSYTDARNYLDRALALAEERGDKRQMAKNLLGFGILYFRTADYPLSLDYDERCLALAEELGDKNMIAISLGNIGTVHHQLADYSRTLDYYDRALVHFEEIRNRVEVANTTQNIGLLYLYLDDYPRALTYLDRALTTAEDIGNKRIVAIALGNIASVYSEQSDYDRAIEYSKRALDLSSQLADPRPVGYWMHVIARTQHKQGNFDIAFRDYLDTLHYRREVLKSNQNIADTLLGLGRLLIDQEKTEEGLERLREAMELATELGEKEIASEAHKELADTYEKNGDLAKAFEHHKMYYALNKEIFSEESRKSVEKFNMRVAVAAMESEKEVQRLKAERSESILRLKERDLANTASSLAAQTELLGNFRADLRKIVLRPDRYEPEDIIKQVRAKLKELPCEMIDFSKFEGQFATVHPEFRARLETTYPELTPQEVKMCMLIHVNLKTPAIARLMCLSERTVEDHRANIRKKMKLDRSDDLAKHLRTIDGISPGRDGR